MNSLPNRNPKATEERLQEIRRLGSENAFHGKPTNHPQIQGDGSYYNLPALKPPVWTWELPFYFFIGGISGVSACLAFFAHAFDSNPSFIRTLLLIGLGGAV